MALKVLRESGHIGATLAGVDLSQPLSSDLAERLRVALDDHHVLFARDQSLDRGAHKRVTEIFGPLFRVPYIVPLAEDPDVVGVLKEASERGIANFGGNWHSDFSFLERPPGGSVLYALEIPPVGGDTLWSNQVVAYETLSDDLREIVDGRGAVHVGTPYGVAHAPGPDVALSTSIQMTRGDPAADAERVHPVVRTHPRSGKRALFVNPIYTVRLEDMSIEESRPVLHRLYRHATRPEFTCRFRWSQGAVAIWDNRTTLHYAINDYDGYRRLLHRTTFEGEVPR